MSTNSGKLRVAPPKGMQHATAGGGNATPSATTNATTDCKALARLMLARNRQCNTRATEDKNPCNSDSVGDPRKVAHATGPVADLCRKLDGLAVPFIRDDGGVVLWLVSDRAATERLRLRQSEPIYTADEAVVLATMPEESARAIHEAKARFGGTVRGGSGSDADQ